MSARGLFGFLIALTFTTCVAAGDEHETDRQRLQGTWNVLAANEEGRTLLPTRVKGAKIVVTGDTMKVFEQNKQRHMTFTLGPTKEPRTIDMIVVEGKQKDKTSQGIYALEGDMLKLCIALPGKARPASFAPSQGSGAMLFVLKRAEP